LRSISVFFRPIVGTQEEYARFFQEGGFGDWTDLHLRQSYGFIRFSTVARVDLFIEAFHGRTFNGSVMTAAHARPSNVGVRTIHLSGIDARATTERSIYNEFSPYGFIRRISLKGAYGFVEFDSVEDAERALNTFTRASGCMLDGCHIGVTYAKNEYRSFTRSLDIKLADVLPENHQFWRQLEKLYADR
jgi:hypothetical protein